MPIKKQKKLFRDPVHNVIHFDLSDPTERMLFALIDTPPVQRLRHVRQLGLACFIYPGAEHTRFGHALGTQHVANRLFEAAAPGGDLFERAVVRAAALLHDVGHAAFSHAFETGLSAIAPFHHERMTCMGILDPSGSIFQILSAFDPRLPQAVVDCIAHERHAWYHTIVSGQLDADRMDYILRDGYMTGIKSYHYDMDRIIEMLEFDALGLIVSHRAIPAVENYLISRYHMYQQVYHHKTVRGGEKLLESLFRRLADLVLEGNREVLNVGRLGRLLGDVIDKRRVDPALCLAVHDAHAWAALDAWCDAADPILAHLSQSLISRRFFKTVEVPNEACTLLRRQWPELEAIVHRSGFEPRYYLHLDTTQNTAFAPYGPAPAPLLPFPGISPKPPAMRHDDIRILLPSGNIAPIQEASPIVDMLTRAPRHIARLCFPEAARPSILEHLRGMRVL